MILNLNRKFFINRIMSAFFVSFFFLLICFYFKEELMYYYGSSFFVYFIISYIAFVVFLIKKYKSYSRFSEKITVSGGIMEIPRVFLGRYIINENKIKSVERVMLGGSIAGLIIGIFNRPALYIGSDFFENRKSVGELEVYLINLSRLNCTSEHYREIVSASNNPARYLFTLIFIVLWMLTSLLIFNVNGSVDDLISLGGMKNKLFTIDDTYRIFSSFFIHTNIYHLMPNLILFSAISRYLECYLGSIRFVNVVFLSALLASFFSWVFSSYDIVVGASGGVFGLLGAYCFIKFKYNDSLPGSINPMSDRMIFLLLLMELCFDIYSNGIDLSSHFGGFFAGLIYVYFLSRYSSYRIPEKVHLMEKYVCIFLGLIYIAGLSYFILKITPHLI